MKKISVIVPVYFNADSLPSLFERLKKVEDEIGIKNGMTMELIFVDDGSGDTSLCKLMDLKKSRPETKIIKLTRNFGAVRASKCGMGFVTGDCFLVLAADLQDPPELIHDMVDKWLSGSKYTICKRTSRDDPAISKFFSRVYYRVLRLLVLKNYPEGGYDMALMDKDLLPYLRQSSKQLYLPVLAHWLGYQPEIISYQRPKRVHGRSRWTFSKKFTAMLDVMLGFSVTPIRLISSIGVLVSLSSFIYGGNILFNALKGDMPVPGFASIVVLITFLLGLIILMLGMIGEYLWRTFDEVNKRPEVVIDEIY